MKLSHIFILVIIAVAAAIIISTFGDASKYVTFKDAIEMAEDGNKEDIHVIGKLKKDSFGNILGLVEDKQSKPMLLSFPMVDSLGVEATVVLYDYPKPNEMKMAEKIVVVGHYETAKKIFLAQKINSKCPSKYKENQKFETK